MMEISNASLLGYPGLAAAQETRDSKDTAADLKTVDKTEFLKLLVAQLKNQDPMDPLDNQAFVAQLATFSSLEQLMSINQAVTKLAGAGETAGGFNKIPRA